MPSNKQLFLQHLGQTSPAPLGIEIERAQGIYMYDKSGKEYIDLVSGVSVSNLGHHHTVIIDAIKEQVDKYMHLMVYGEIVQAPQVKFAKLLCENLPTGLDSVYLVNSGSEAIEGAMKLAKRLSGRSQIISCKNAYHGGTHGALSIMGAETFKTAFRPLLPDTMLIEFNNFDDINKITEQTACFFIEPIQGEGGIISPKEGYLQAIRKRCDETGTLLIFDEIQTGFGRTGELFAFQQYNVVPDIMCIAKAMGGGMPIGGFVTSLEKMKALTYDPVLGHITTFGGHPVSSAAAYAHLKFLIDNPQTYKDADRKADIFYKKLINHPMVKEIRKDGFFMAIDLGDGEKTSKMADLLLKNGIVTDLFLFNKTAFRISPPLPMTDEEIIKSSETILECLNLL
ncbi:MAG: aspartate aminotransferase family protein [Bacteroidales bacterium]|nr:aspartate aminotransferase family protein [Bacteroidales bacterium]